MDAFVGAGIVPVVVVLVVAKDSVIRADVSFQVRVVCARGVDDNAGRRDGLPGFIAWIIFQKINKRVIMIIFKSVLTDESA